MGESRAEKRSGSGCGLFHIVFGRRSVGPRRSTSLPSSNLGRVTRYPSTPSSKLRNQSFHHRSFDSSEVKTDRKHVDRIIDRPGKNYTKSPILLHHHPQSPNKHYQNEPRKNTPRNGQNPEIGIAGELENMIMDYQTRKGGEGLMRASSSNVMLFGNLGNLKQAGNSPTPKSVMGKVEKGSVSLCRALSTRMDPEQLKILGNEDYKSGRFAEALALYDAAISVDPNKASYRSNKSAALVGLGKLLEAAFECREAIRIDPFYQRAHNRLAIIYLRLGEAEKAVYHFKQSGSDADPDAINKAKQLQIHLAKCTEAKRQRDWNTVLKETGICIEAYADSSPLIFGLRSEAFLKLNRHQEATETMENSPNFDIDHCIKFFGPVGCSSLLLFRAQVDLVAGRFDEAIATMQRATRLDPSNKEASLVMRRMRGVATARANGNELFKVGRYSEACIAYGEGLSQDTYNAVLLCNRAACRSKLGQYHKAIEDCNAALKVRPSYSKARLRRADCYAKMGKWGECVQDCEVLLKENPDDEEIGRMMNEAKVHIERNGGNWKKGVNIDSGMIVISSNQHFRDYVTSYGISVVLFSIKTKNTKIIESIEQLNKRYPSVNFVKVEVEDHPSLVKSEGLNSLPTFIIYANGSRAEEVPGDKYDLLESWIKHYMSS